MKNYFVLKMSKTTLAVLASAAVTALSAITMKAFLSNSGSGQNTDNEGHQLVSLWSEYNAALRSDRPQKQLDILDKIKKDASSRHYTWDFYDAAEKYVQVGASRNWKLRDSLNRTFRKEVESYGDPLAVFLSRYEAGTCQVSKLYDYLKENESGLKSSANRGFYSGKQINGRTYIPGNFRSRFYENDYEYALWTLLTSAPSSTMKESSVYKELADYEKDSYPLGAFLDYLAASSGKSRDDRSAALKAFSVKHSGKAIALWADKDLISNAFDSLNRNRSGENAYKDLYAECKEFEKRRSSFTGREKYVVEELDQVKGLIDELTGKSLAVSVSGGKASVLVRNAADLRLRLYAVGQQGNSDKALVDKVLNNEKRSFYVYDTLSFDLPALSDGTYRATVTSGKTEASTLYQNYHISLAIRRDSRGYSIYAADWKSGEPLRKADLALLKNGSIVAEAKDFAFDGFTHLPESIAGKIGAGSSYTVKCSVKGDDGMVWSSEQLYFYGRTIDSNENEPVSARASVFTDQGAYNPGDTLKFKAVLYRTDYVDFAGTVAAGTPVEIVLNDSEGNEVGSMKLETNEFGSVAGSFALPVGRRNGWFTLNVFMDRSAAFAGERVLASRSVRVDEFILPSFHLHFDKSDRLNLPGDPLSVRGQLESYSGHSLAGVTAEYSVESWGSVVDSGKLDIDGDGRFELGFSSEESSGWRSYVVTVKVTDGTGETCEFSRMLWTSGTFNVDVNHGNPAVGQGSVAGQNRPSSKNRYRFGIERGFSIVDRDNAVICLKVSNPDGGIVPVNIGYILKDEAGKRIFSSSAQSGSEVKIDFSKYKSGLYRFVAECSANSAAGKEYKDTTSLDLLYIKDGDTVLDAPVKDFFKVPESEVEDNMELMIGNADGHPVWAVAEVFGIAGDLLDRQLVHLEGRRAETGSLKTLKFSYKNEYPDAVRLQVFYFRDGDKVTFSNEYHRAAKSLDLPLEWSSFVDRSVPGGRCEVSLKTLPGVEAVVAVFDKSTEAIASNRWNEFRTNGFHIPEIYVNSVCGAVGENEIAFLQSDLYSENIVVAYGSRTKSARMSAPMAMEAVAMDDAVGAVKSEESEESVEEDIPVRDNFATSLAFIPYLRSSEDGTLSFDFQTSGKLSTYYVSVFAHTKEMKNAALRREMVVTIPVKVAVVPPACLYAGDLMNLSVSLSSNADVPVSGSLKVYVYDSADYQGKVPVKEYGKHLEVPAGKSVAEMFDIDALPETEGGVLGFRVVFIADAGGGKFSDGIFVTVPVLPAVQTVTEAHSAVLLDGMDKEKVLETLRSSFVNGSSYGAEYKEISIIEMLKETLPEKVEPSGNDVLSLSEALYVRKVAGSLGMKMEMAEDNALLAKVMACRNADGGFSWFEGMKSSPVITAVILERFGKMRSAGLLDIDLSSSVKYLDAAQFSGRSVMPYWCGGLDDAQYMFVRSLYPEVSFTKPSSSDRSVQKRYEEFCKDAKEYLVPEQKRGLNGYLMGKVRRVSILRNLLACREGLALAKSWGLSFNAGNRISASLDADILSLTEYAVAHRDGGIYYPNLVMPFRGLLESEAYAHSMLCDLMSGYSAGHKDNTETGRIADGIRIWLMLQKETQHWDSDPAFVDAVNSVMAGDAGVKSTSVIVMTKRFEKPLDEVKASGNGFNVRRRFFKEVAVSVDGSVAGVKDRDVKELKEIAPGEVLHIGDKVIVRCEIHNDENRSFVKVSVPREAAFRPVQQLSGLYGLGISPLRVSGWYSFLPQGYRNVKAAVTEYYFDSYPEENTVIEEELFVTQSGVFSAPVLTVESLYAPHYRANSAFYGKVTSER